MPTQSSLLREIRAAFAQDPRINKTHAAIGLVCRNGTLMVTGEVETIAAKKLALAHARTVYGIYNTIDHLRVKPATSVGDGAIRDALCRYLLREPALLGLDVGVHSKGKHTILRQSYSELPGRIIVEVTDGSIALSGQVTSLSHKRLCGVFAWWTPGCGNVVNLLDVTPLEYDNDDEIADALGLVFEIDPLVHSAQLRIDVRNNVVTLRGLLGTHEERRMAESDAWYVYGVTDVISHIAVSH
jgi:osmotically-inducible protein OsmY